MEEQISISRSEFNQTVQNYETIYEACAEEYWLEPIEDTRTYFSSKILLKMLNKDVQGIPKLSINITNMKTYKKICAPDLITTIQSLQTRQDKPLPWLNKQTPSAYYLTVWLFWKNPSNEIFKKQQKNYGIEESTIQLRKDTWQKLQKATSLSNTKAILIKRQKSEIIKIEKKKIELKIEKQKKRQEFTQKLLEEQKKKYQEFIKQQQDLFDEENKMNIEQQ